MMNSFVSEHTWHKFYLLVFILYVRAESLKMCAEMRIIMKENTNLEKLKAGLNTAFVDYANNSSLAYRPEFISNNYQKLF